VFYSPSATLTGTLIKKGIRNKATVHVDILYLYT
jgi:hypothetical protein